MNNNVKKQHKGVFKRFLSILLAVSIVITGLNLENIISNAATDTTTGTTNIYLVDNTAEKWLGNDSAVLELVDNSNGHDHYTMTKVDDITWSASVPTSAYNITFN